MGLRKEDVETTIAQQRCIAEHAFVAKSLTGDGLEACGRYQLKNPDSNPCTYHEQVTLSVACRELAALDPERQQVLESRIKLLMKGVVGETAGAADLVLEQV